MVVGYSRIIDDENPEATALFYTDALLHNWA